MVMGALAAMIERRMWEGESLCCYAARSEAAKPERENENGNENVKEKKKECALKKHRTEREEGGEWVVWWYIMNERINQEVSFLNMFFFSVSYLHLFCIYYHYYFYFIFWLLLAYSLRWKDWCFFFLFLIYIYLFSIYYYYYLLTH
jgi:hypothetical protein